MSYMEDQLQRQYEAWMEQEREWYDMCNQLCHDGWHHASLNRHISTEEMTQLCAWLKEHFYGRHEQFNDEVLLPSEKDVTWFLLTWA